MLRPTFNWLSMLRRLWPRLKISGARHKVHSERERHTLIPDPCRLGIYFLIKLASRCGDKEILRYSRVPSRVPRLRTSAWAGYDTRALDKEGLGDVKLVSPIRTIDTQIIKCVSTLVSQTWCFGVKEGAQYDKRPSHWHSKWLKSPRTLKRATQKGALVSKKGHSMTRDPPYSRWLKSPRSLLRTRKKKGESRWC